MDMQQISCTNLSQVATCNINIFYHYYFISLQCILFYFIINSMHCFTYFYYLYSIYIYTFENYFMIYLSVQINFQSLYLRISNIIFISLLN